MYMERYRTIFLSGTEGGEVLYYLLLCMGSDARMLGFDSNSNLFSQPHTHGETERQRDRETDTRPQRGLPLSITINLSDNGSAVPSLNRRERYHSSVAHHTLE